MTFNWLEYLNLAKSLKCSNGTLNEAACRASISRAYYAAFCLSRNYLCDHEDNPYLRSAKIGDRAAIDHIIDRAKSVHNFVILEFEESLFDEGEIFEKKTEIADELRLLKRRRKKADYDDHVSNIESETEASIDCAENIISNLNFIVEAKIK